MWDDGLLDLWDIFSARFKVEVSEALVVSILDTDDGFFFSFSSLSDDIEAGAWVGEVAEGLLDAGVIAFGGFLTDAGTLAEVERKVQAAFWFGGRGLCGAEVGAEVVSFEEVL